MHGVGLRPLKPAEGRCEGWGAGSRHVVPLVFRRFVRKKFFFSETGSTSLALAPYLVLCEKDSSRRGENKGVWVGKYFLGLLVFFAVSPSIVCAHDNQIYSIVDEALKAKVKTQDILTTWNENFNLSMQNLEDLQTYYNWVRFQKEQSKKSQKFLIEKWMPEILRLDSVVKDSSAKIQNLLIEDPTFKRNFGFDGRLLGLAVEPQHLINMGTISFTSQIAETGLAVREVCFSDKSKTTDAVDLFLNTKAGGVSCAQAISDVELVEDGAIALSRKVELLTGSPLPKEAIENPDPNYALDFSHAPELSAIYMSYLEFKHDFSGRLMAQIITYHAKKGTDIRIILPGLPVPGTNFVKKKDAELLKQIEDLGSNIQVEKFMFRETPDLKTPFRMIVRSQHAKMLVAIGKDHSKSGVILGGRNIKDTFYMTKTPDYSKWPEMVQYQVADEKFGVFRDMEVYIKDHQFAEQSAAQFLAFWNFNSNGPKIVRTTEHLPVSVRSEEWSKIRNQDGTFVRQFISMPFVDDLAAEKLFAEMVDSAKSEILLVTPYLRPRKSLNDAIIRALRRGVTVELLTSFDLGLDNVAPFTEDMNKLSVNKFIEEYERLKDSNPEVRRADKLLKVHEWQEASVMHSKVVSIDKKLLFVGSINLDQRGFTNDTENGVLLIGKPAMDFAHIFQDVYLPLSKPLTDKQKTNKLNRLLIAFLDLLNMT